MRLIKLFMFTPAVFLVAFFVSGSAQGSDHLGVIADYCIDVDRDADEAKDEIGEAAADLAVCGAEYFDCLDGFGPPEPVSCIADVKKCQKRGARDIVQACKEFLHEFKRETKDAERSADVRDVLPEFLDWFFSDDSDECLARANAIIEFCTELIDIDELVTIFDQP